VVIAHGPDNILAIGRGLSQGHVAAGLTFIATGLSVLALQRK
jgi:threonine/homoserine/homoserine lactone efflux protein